MATLRRGRPSPQFSRAMLRRCSTDYTWAAPAHAAEFLTHMRKYDLLAQYGEQGHFGTRNSHSVARAPANANRIAGPACIPLTCSRMMLDALAGGFRQLLAAVGCRRDGVSATTELRAVVDPGTQPPVTLRAAFISIEESRESRFVSRLRCALKTSQSRRYPHPTPKPGEVVVDVHASALNFPDVLMIQGKYQSQPPFPFSPRRGVFRRDRVNVGEGVTDWSAWETRCSVEAGLAGSQSK